MLPVHLQPRVTFRSTSSFAISCARSWHARRFAAREPHSREPRTRDQAGVHRTTVANAYAELESEGLIQGTSAAHVYPRATAMAQDHASAPPVLNGGDSIRWNCSLPMSVVTKWLSPPYRQRASGFALVCNGRPAPEHFPVEELQICVNAFCRRTAPGSELGARGAEPASNRFAALQTGNVPGGTSHYKRERIHWRAGGKAAEHFVTTLIGKEQFPANMFRHSAREAQEA